VCTDHHAGAIDRAIHGQFFVAEADCETFFFLVLNGAGHMAIAQGKAVTFFSSFFH
jgi:hypothetical protein